jgi:hypothetical protein
MKKTVTIIFVLLSGIVYSQDTIRMMHYNLMYYGQTTSYCTDLNNNLAAKDGYLKTIIQYVKPDIFTANEIGPNTSPQHLLDNCLNVDGVTYYSKTNYTNFSNTDLCNMLYYNSNKLGLISQNTIPTSVRDINIYKLYYKAPDLSTTHDTAYINCVVVHLKAGTGYESERAVQTNTLMGYLSSINAKANYTLTGDFNVYTSSESCFQNLVSYSNTNVRFYDPINELGDWNSNSSYKNYHTQSTHTESTGCFATGGMDDRFDFILVSDDLKTGAKKAKCLPATYRAVGQDGQHMNGEINTGTNNSAPQAIIDALYGMSDHLPVTMDILIGGTVGINDYSNPVEATLKNNITDNELVLMVSPQSQSELQISITSITGQQVAVQKYHVDAGFSSINIPAGFLNNGTYYLTVSTTLGSKSFPFVVMK